MPAMIVLGDKTDHGGEVIEASGVTDTCGKRIARVGDKVACPKKGHGTTEIVTGDPTTVIDGKAVAFHGCKTSCGATLISSQSVTSVNFGDSAKGTPTVRGTSGSAASTLTESHLYDEQPQLVALPIEGVPFCIEVPDGRKFCGRTGADGLLPRIETRDEVECTVYWGDEAIAKEYEHLA